MADSHAVFEEYAQDPEVTRYMIWSPHHRVETSEYFMRECLARWEAGQEYSWGITLRGELRLAGMISLRPSGHRAELGYVLARRLWGRGVMTEAARTLIALVFQDPSMFRVWATCDVDNVGSARVMEKSGMTREGVLRRWVVHPQVSAEPRDALVYSVVRA